MIEARELKGMLAPKKADVEKKFAWDDYGVYERI